MSLRRAARDADDRAACVHIPIRSAEADECRNDIDTSRILDLLRDPLGIRSGVDEADAVTQPLDRGTSNEDGTLECVLDLAVEAPGDRRHEAVLGVLALRARIHEHEAARAVRVLCRARLEAVLTEECALLVACCTGDRNRRTEDARQALAVDAGGRFDFRQHGLRHIEIAEEVVIPLQRVDVEEHRAGRVGIIRDMRLAAREFPDQPGIDRTEDELALLCSLLCTLDMVEDPADLRAGEIRIDRQARLVANLIHEPLGLERLGDRCGLAGLPDDGVVDRTARLLVPDHGRLALVRDADAGDVARDETGLLESFLHDSDHRAPDFLSVMLDPARFREVLRELFLRDTDNLGVAVEDDGTVGRRTCIKSHYILLCHVKNLFLLCIFKQLFLEAGEPPLSIS